MPRRTHSGTSGRDRRRAQRPKPLPHRREGRDGRDGRGGGRSDGFRCAGCRLDVPRDAPGTAHRNHCPSCLVSLHVDRRVPGDRASDCRGRMEALGISTRPDGEWMLVHQCRSCGELSVNRIAGDDNALALVRLALRPLTDSGMAHRALLTL
ncbi:RNHCP domain-containing protein [Streptomyces sp. enrichment culture]|uniref:RNHCP domain-containing protein n=1 Tax=Streptomyces sp. enrichment culture TaxID=1795815 RepID=UPI003F54DE9C